MLRALWIAVIAVVPLAHAAAAADTACNLEEIVRLDAASSSSDFFLLPATFGARQTRLVLSLAAWSELREDLVTQLGLKSRRIRTAEFRGVAGDSAKQYVIVPEFQIGSRTFKDGEFLVATEDYGAPIAALGGAFGADRLSYYDVELNGATKAVTLYRPDVYCSGQLVRWSDNWAEIPVKLIDDIPEIRVEVEGKRLKATLHTGSSATLMNLGVARAQFGITPSSKGVKALGDQSVSGGNALTLYTYRFKTLDVGGLVFNDVEVVLGDFVDTDIALGMREIRKLHLYVAFKRKTVYATWAVSP